MKFITFYIGGQKKGFSSRDLFLLWKLLDSGGLTKEIQNSWSIQSVDRYISFINADSSYYRISEDRGAIEDILAKLYAYRTQVALHNDAEKFAIRHTLDMPTGQMCILLFARSPAIYAKLILKTNEGLLFSILQSSEKNFTDIPVTTGTPLTVYFWKRADAGYIFKTTTIMRTKADGQVRLQVKHKRDLLRTQKRKSIRASCQFSGVAVPVHYNTLFEESSNSGGVKCTIYDVSEDGAMFIIKGKILRGLRIKLQFTINDIPIDMWGTVVYAGYNRNKNISKAHFYCEHLMPRMKNAVLGYVYNIVPGRNNQDFRLTF